MFAVVASEESHAHRKRCHGGEFSKGSLVVQRGSRSLELPVSHCSAEALHAGELQCHVPVYFRFLLRVYQFKPFPVLSKL